MSFEIHPWKVVETGLDKECMRLSESLTSTGNGYMGMRGNFEEDYTGDTHLGTYIGGVWFPDKTRVGWWKNGYPQYGRQRRCRAEGQFRTATATGERAALPAKQKFAPKPAKLKAAPLQQGQRSGFGHQYLRLRAASAFFLRFTLGFS